MKRLSALLFVCTLAACSGQNAPVGASCSSSSACAGGLTCVKDFPGGVCTKPCAETGCDEGQTCKSFGGASLCMPNCSSRSECRAGYQCFNTVCLPPCSTAEDCAPRGYSCEAGQCTELPGAANGASCSVDEDCSSQLCLLGTCRQSCDSEALCPVAETCAVNAIGDNGDLTPTTQIRPACVPRRGGVSPGAVCERDDDCDQGTCQYGRCSNLCNSQAQCGASGVCSTVAYYLDSGVYPNIQICLKSPSLITFDGLFGMASVPSSARSLAIFATLKNTSNYDDGAGVVTLAEPDGTEIYTAPQTEDEYFAALIRYLPTEISSTMLVPNTPLYTLKQGMYTFVVGTFLGGAMTTTVYLKVAKDPITTGTVALNFYVSDLSGAACSRARVTAADGETKLASAISRIKEIYAQAGITIDEVTFQSTTAANSINSDDPSELGKVLEAATKGQSTQIGLDIVLIRSIGSDGNPGLISLGVAGGIPSAPVLGNPHSGVVIAMDAVCDYSTNWPDILASTIAHEGGHSLGLFHNIEQTGDTDKMSDNNTDGARNLMYWLEADETGAVPKLSAQQSEVLRLHPNVRQ